jgi:hypothetical protein
VILCIARAPVLANIVAVSGGIAARTAPALLPRTL